MTEHIRNIAIIAHVDHGKTTLVDQLLSQTGTLSERAAVPDRVMDSNDLERERGITILAKNTAVLWKEWRINIVDTPGHADFGGEVERVLNMVDSVLLLVDAVEGPMPQTRFVTQKALERGLRPIVVINKIDRPGARANWVLDRTFDLFDNLGATDEQLDFPVVYASGLHGFSGDNPDMTEGNMDFLIQAIVDHVPPPDVDPDGPFQLQVSALDYSSYVGVIGIGKISRGSVTTNTAITVVAADGTTRAGRVLQIFKPLGLERVETDKGTAGDIVAVTGVTDLRISETLCDPACVEGLPLLSVDEPTVSMTFQVNDSPYSGQDGKFLTSRQIRERLDRELQVNVALRVDDTEDADRFVVSGRGELHLAILIENMRREGYELAVSRPEVIFREIDGETCEPYEALTIDVDEQYQGSAMELLGERGAEIRDMAPDGKGRVRVDYIIPSRGLIGLRTSFLTATSGTGLLYHVFEKYGPLRNTSFSGRKNGVLISNGKGKAVAYALFNLQERGRMMVSPGAPVYEGMVIGVHAKDNDLVVNPMKGKQLTNYRASGKDDNVLLTPPLLLTLDQALEFISDDELLEITPKTLRVRKRHLQEHERKRAMRLTANA